MISADGVDPAPHRRPPWWRKERTGAHPSDPRRQIRWSAAAAALSLSRAGRSALGRSQCDGRATGESQGWRV